jgi:S-adenosylmethionine-diacylglycerol 3-amino-3-carboxypropyl transferase
MGSLERLAAAGPDYSGRYEAMFAALNRALTPSWATLQRVLESAVPIELPDLPQVDAAFSEVMSIENLVALFGRDATQNPRMPFAEHFAARVRAAFKASAPRRNPFLWQMLAGKFPPDVAWDWFDSAGPSLVEPEIVHGLMKPALGALPARSVDFVHLSNILDWLSPDDAAGVLDSAARVLKRGSRVVVRQLNSSLDIPALGSRIVWSPGLGGLMQSRDRSFFYPEIHIGSAV